MEGPKKIFVLFIKIYSNGNLLFLLWNEIMREIVFCFAALRRKRRFAKATIVGMATPGP